MEKTAVVDVAHWCPKCHEDMAPAGRTFCVACEAILHLEVRTMRDDIEAARKRARRARWQQIEKWSWRVLVVALFFFVWWKA
jgi:hypothetical protein